MTLKQRTLASLTLIASLAFAHSSNATLFTFNLDGLNSGYLATIDFAAELGLAPGSEVIMTQMGWDFTITTEVATGIVSAGFGFEPIGADITISRPEAPLIVTSNTGGLFDLVTFMGPGVHVPNGVLDLYLLTYTPLGNGGAGFFTEATWTGTMTLNVQPAQVPLPGGIILLLSALLGIPLFRQR